MSDTTTENTTTTETKTKATTGKGKNKSVKARVATPKTKTPNAPKAAKPKKEKAPREDRSDWGTFALRLPTSERDAFHAASGPAGASRFARAVIVAFANEDEAAFKGALAEARKLRV